MIIAVYDPGNMKCFMCHHNAKDVQVIENEYGSFNIQWNEGSLGGVDNLLILDEGTAVAEGDDISSLVSLDRKEEFKTKTIKQKFEELKTQQVEQDESLAYLFESMLSGGV